MGTTSVLSRIKILEVTIVTLYHPGKLLAGFSADLLKVEPPGGDEIRTSRCAGEHGRVTIAVTSGLALACALRRDRAARTRRRPSPARAGRTTHPARGAGPAHARHARCRSCFSRWASPLARSWTSTNCSKPRARSDFSRRAPPTPSPRSKSRAVGLLVVVSLAGDYAPRPVDAPAGRTPGSKNSVTGRPLSSFEIDPCVTSAANASSSCEIWHTSRSCRRRGPSWCLMSHESRSRHGMMPSAPAG